MDLRIECYEDDCAVVDYSDQSVMGVVKIATFKRHADAELFVRAKKVDATIVTGFSNCVIRLVGDTEFVGHRFISLSDQGDVKPTTELFWNGRVAKVEDGMVFLSRKGDLSDFDVTPGVSEDGFRAIALNPGSKVTSVGVVDKKRLRIEAVGGVYLLVDKKGESHSRDLWIEPYKPALEREDVKPDIVIGGEDADA